MRHLGLSITAALACLLLATSVAQAARDRAEPASEAPATPATVFSKTDLIVQWARGADHVDMVAARADAVFYFDGDVGNRRFQLVEVEPGQSAGEALSSLESDRAVAVVERDSYSVPHAVPDDPLFDQLWGLRNLGTGIAGFGGAVADDDINAVAAWDRTVGEESVVVADLDSGYRFEHPDLAGVAWTNPDETDNEVDDDGNGIVDDLRGADFVGVNGEAPDPDGDPTDDDLISGGHGVHTAGTIGAEGNNGVGITGVAQDVRIMPLRVCSRFPALESSRCPVSAQIAAIEYAADKGARVVNMSLGGTAFGQAQVNAIAEHPELLFVISAGNDGGDNDGGQPAPKGHHYPCDYRPDEDAEPPVPAAIDNIVCVAATDQADGLAGFSDWGAVSVDLGAPGTETLSTYPFVVPLSEDFSGTDFASKWPATGASGGFQRTAEAPLTSFGMTDVVGPPVANTVRETTSAAVTVPPNGGCRLNQSRKVVLSGGDQFRYSVLLDGVDVEEASSTPGSSAAPGLEKRFLDLPAAFEAGGSVQVRFRFSTGPAPSAGSGAWIDDVSLSCVQGIGQASAYGFLQGTSMAAPHVSGAAALLFSAEPLASVTQVRDALLDGVDAIPSLTGKTTTGGRLDVAKALDSLEGQSVDNTAPATPSLTATSPVSPAEDTQPKIIGSAEAGANVRIFGSASCKGSPIATGSAEELAGPGIAVAAPAGFAYLFTAAVVDPARNASPCSAPIAYASTPPSEGGGGGGGGEQPGPVIVPSTDPGPETPPPPPPPGPPRPTCTVPKLVGKSLARAKRALRTAHCRLGVVRKPRARRGRRLPRLVVRSSRPGAGAKPASGRVNLRLAPKPRPRKAHR
jgi:subtilisin family serine protease